MRVRPENSWFEDISDVFYVEMKQTLMGEVYLDVQEALCGICLRTCVD